METEKKKRGGARPGAGRKKMINGRNIKMSFSLSSKAANELERQAPLPVQILKEAQYLVRSAGIEVSGGFVRQNQHRNVHQGAGNGHPLLLATRHLVGTVRHAVCQPHLAQGFLGIPRRQLASEKRLRV